jgi:hypothetical protein
VSNVYYDTSAQGAANIKKAMIEFDNCVQAGDCSHIEGLNACNARNATALQSVYYNTVFHFALMTQYNLPYPALYSVAYPVETLLNETTAANTTGAVLRSTFNLAFNLSLPATQCVDFNSPDMDVSLFSLVGKSYWSAMCSYFPTSQVAIPEGSLLPPRNTTGRVETCRLGREWQRWPYNETEEWFRGEYGFTDESLDRAGRLLVISGQRDPMLSAAMPHLSMPNSREHTRLFSVTDMSHCEDENPFSSYPRGVKVTIDQVSFWTQYMRS